MVSLEQCSEPFMHVGNCSFYFCCNSAWIERCVLARCCKSIGVYADGIEDPAVGVEKNRTVFILQFLSGAPKAFCCSEIWCDDIHNLEFLSLL